MSKLNFIFFALYAATINGLLALFILLRVPSDSFLNIATNVAISSILLYFYFGFPYVIFNKILKSNNSNNKLKLIWLLWLTIGIISSIIILTATNKEVGLKIFTAVNITIFTTIAYFVNKHKIAGHDKETIFK